MMLLLDVVMCCCGVMEHSQFSRDSNPKTSENFYETMKGNEQPFRLLFGFIHS